MFSIAINFSDADKEPRCRYLPAFSRNLQGYEFYQAALVSRRHGSQQRGESESFVIGFEQASN